MTEDRNMASSWKLLLLLGIVLVNASLIHCDNDAEQVLDDNRENASDEPAEDVVPEKPAEGAEEEEDPDLAEEEVYEDNGVLVLNSENFDKVVNAHDIILVEFYAPWCGHCKQLAPEYERAAEILKEADPPVALAKVDATEDNDLAQRFGVSGYPTLKFFKNGVVNDYDGPRQEAGIVSYMKERADPSWKPPPEAVLTLGKENFTETVYGEELILVEFYAPWCGHCKTLAPELEKAAQDLKGYSPPIPVAKVDATVETELATQYKVSGYPSLKVFRKGREFEYAGGRDKYGIVDYMAKLQGPPTEEKKSLKEVKSFMKEDDITVFGFFEDDKAKSWETFEDAANELREDYTFGHSFDKEARDNYRINPNSVVVFNSPTFYTKYENKWNTMDITEETTRDDIKIFIEKHKYPLVGQYSWSTKEKRYKGVRPLVLVFYTIDWSFDHRVATQQTRQRVAAVAKDYKDLTFAVASEDDHQDLIKQFGLEDSGEDINIGILGLKDKKYVMGEEDFDEEVFREFLDNFQAGKVKPRIKSQPIPKKKGPVTVVVGNTFEKIVNDKKKDVLIEFYAPWCGHCKSLEPTYKKLAKKYKGNKQVVIAKLDATANDVPDEYEASGFPTIFFVPTNSKDKPIKYEGTGRELEDLDKFIQEHATVSLGDMKKEEL